MEVTAKMPPELKRILEVFDKAGIGYLLFKCEHILEGQNKNLDLLFRTTEEYNHAASLLESEGYVLYLGEEVERYKSMYLLFDGKNLSAVHLHREVAWHGVAVLDKEQLFERASGNLPSAEDSLLIHSAHALFENFKVKEYHRRLLEKYKQQAKDWSYIDRQLLRFGWKQAFYMFLSSFSVTVITILNAYGGRLQKEPLLFFTLSKKLLQVGLKKTSLKKRGYLLCLIGMNGSGKSTTKEALLQAYQPLTSFVAGQYGYYFGWKQSFLGKTISYFPSKRGEGKKLFDTVSEEKIKDFDLFQEFLFLFIYLKFLGRYVKDIYPYLRKNKFVITDRYFYDLYGQYPYSERSRILKLLPIPRPDHLFLLNAAVGAVMKRDKGGKAARTLQPKEKLEGQRRRYLTAAKKNHATIINAENNFEENILTIINASWNGYIERCREKY